MQVLVIDDDSEGARTLGRILESGGYEARVASDRIQGESLAPCADIVILDRALSNGDPMDVLANVKHARPGLPVILLGGECDAADRARVLDLGASDYITTPLDAGELLARIRARLRESSFGSGVVLSAAGIRLNQVTREATRSGRVAHLGQREAELLAYLMRRAGETCTRPEILSEVWQFAHDPETNVVQVYIGYLRQKLAAPGAPPPIETVRSIGYRLTLN